MVTNLWNTQILLHNINKFNDTQLINSEVNTVCVNASLVTLN